MLISRTPFRISFFGGGTDYPAYFRDEGGYVLSTTIDKYCYLNCRYFPPFFPEKFRIVWSHIEIVSNINDILHPAVRGGLKYLGFDNNAGVELHHQGDLPARAGMGSSSAFAVGLINVLTKLRGEPLNKYELALKAIDLEQNVLKENVGCQDQIASAYGGFNSIRFFQDGAFCVEPVEVPRQHLLELESRLLLFYTGTGRSASEMAAKVIANLGSKKQILRRMRQMVQEAIGILKEDHSLDQFGKLLDETWSLKKQITPDVTNSRIDLIYETGIKNGAIGGKLLGAGGTGFVLFYCPIEFQENVKQALRHYLHVPFRFEFEGSTVIYHGSAS